MWECVFRGHFWSGLDQHPDGRRSGVPDADGLVLQNPVPVFGIELGLIDDRGDTVQQRRDDAVCRPGHPAGIGCAPVDIAVVQVQGIAAGYVVHRDRAVDVLGALRCPSGAAGEVQQRGILGGGWLDRGFIGGGVHEAVEVLGAVDILGVPAGNDQHLFHRGHLIADCGDLALVDRRCGHQHVGRSDVHPCFDRLWTECGEQR